MTYTNSKQGIFFECDKKKPFLCSEEISFGIKRFLYGIGNLIQAVYVVGQLF